MAILLMRIAAVKIKYPVVAYSDRFITSRKKNRKYSLKSYLDSAGFVGNLVIDSAGHQFRITDVTVLGRAFAPWHNWFNDDKIMRISITYEFIRQMTFDEVRDEILGLFERHPRWASAAAKRHMRDLLFSAETIQGMVGLSYAYGNP